MTEANTLEQGLPDEVAGKIISMVPFPHLLKARVLSRPWSSEFSASPVNLTFQYQVKTVCSKWESYCPVYISRDCWLTGYDHVNDRWQKMFRLSYFADARKIPKFIRYTSSMSGALLCGILNSDCSSVHGISCHTNIFVTNVITKDWKKLPSRPDMEKPDAVQIHASGACSYTVMVLSHPDPPELREQSVRLITFQIYESTKRTWTLMELKLHDSILLVYQDSVYNTSDHKFYVLYRDVLRSLRTDIAAFELMAYDNVKGCATRIQLSVPSIRHIDAAYTTGLVECDGDVILILVMDPMIYSDGDSFHGSIPPWDPMWGVICAFLPSRLPSSSVLVLKFDQETHGLIPIALGPPCTIIDAYCDRFTCHNSCIYLASSKHDSPVVIYNVREKLWSALSPSSDVCNGNIFSFQPGLDPFAAV
ncbi:hypothetical protein MPTK1_1g22830 [Marchantia polymorpha subsp. ruderalis]|nr:hypothetical protein MARPO_0065s0094 [Marchantia polymorpha]BBM99659.1 hypothetical protein Mp_1g22830 [Marchantia polymorpha subsp. ruderalis]|eukprot:PTQ36299.1 hypothetical protein MARPO_0065s0094 [Marchantia polymorpha]